MRGRGARLTRASSSWGTNGCPLHPPLPPGSIQRASVWVLDHYYTDFPVYNPALLNLPKSILSKKMTGFKVYSLDGNGRQPPASFALTFIFTFTFVHLS